jgi:aryl-alcohol dehydrogenase-like predicted oxidoreductase
MDRLYETFREAGGNFFDTAHCYCFWLPDGNGTSERTLGDVLRRHHDRDNVVIGTKGGHPAVEPGYPRPDAYLSPPVIASDIQESLERLGVEYIDLYFLHRDDLRVPVVEVIEMMNVEVKRGRIRYFGASNWLTTRIAEANAYADAHRLHGFVMSQPRWTLAHPTPAPRPGFFLTEEDEAWHTRQQMPVVVYSPTACGYFASDGQRAGAAFDNPVSRARLQRVKDLAAQLAATPNQIALAWLLSQPFTVMPILGTSNLEHQADALGAATLQLTAEQTQWLRNG